ncbi:hypothetical protein NDU88_005766 [Pleurodeles waltl]|uniref:Uncharacterized protein n=1 Tax=Pleurodeles waltl TaxID=8319 RepID=A0AAV7RL46_PLEWA|nr:hypothetical protein NDU88_005766 [Pleurodeles waltl]
MTLFVTPLRLNECNVATLLINQIDAETRPESTWLKNDTRLVNAVAGEFGALTASIYSITGPKCEMTKGLDRLSFSTK